MSPALNRPPIKHRTQFGASSGLRTRRGLAIRRQVRAVHNAWGRVEVGPGTSTVPSVPGSLSQSPTVSTAGPSQSAVSLRHPPPSRPCCAAFFMPGNNALANYDTTRRSRADVAAVWDRPNCDGGVVLGTEERSIARSCQCAAQPHRTCKHPLSLARSRLAGTDDAWCRMLLC